MVRTRDYLFCAAFTLGLAACPADSGEPGAQTDSDGIDSAASSAGQATTAGSASGSASTSGSPGGGSTADEPSDSGNATVGPGAPTSCGSTVYACGDETDNDGDGFIDLFDPECTGPCDDDESSFQTGLPGDNVDCKQDCFFDGNSGQGDDRCIWDLRCDPENPGKNVGCEYTASNSCGNSPPNQDPQCVKYCEQFTPPGCDCFGCCTVETPSGPVHVFLNSGPDCSFDNLDGCQSCTPQIEECGNPCNPDECEVCFGETEVPDECPGGQQCDSGITCKDNADCPSEYYCYLGCCYPPPEG